MRMVETLASQPVRRLLVEAGVLDRHRLQLLVFGVEWTVPLLGQIKVAVGVPAQEDRDAEEAAHRRVVRREPDRARVVGDRLEAERLGIGDQDAEDAASARQLPDRCVGLGVDAGGQEALEGGAGLVDDAESRLARPG